MLITKTAKLQDVQNKGQRAVIVATLSKLSKPITLEELTKKVVSTGQYNGKGTKGHVNEWAKAKAGGDLGSVRYHVRALATEKRVTVQDGTVEKPAKVRKPKAEPVAPEQAAEMLEQQAEQIEAADAA